jgi:predicted nucleotidyltransferase
MTSQADILPQIIDRLKEEFNPNKIFLFGLRAKGIANTESDYYLLLVVKDSQLTKFERMQKAHEVLWGIWEAVDVIVVCGQSILPTGKMIYESSKR